MVDKFFKVQNRVISALSSLEKEGSFMEHQSMINALRELRSGILDLSCEDAYKKAIKIRKKSYVTI